MGGKSASLYFYIKFQGTGSHWLEIVAKRYINAMEATSDLKLYTLSCTHFEI
jgi:hypothetical protein